MTQQNVFHVPVYLFEFAVTPQDDTDIQQKLSEFKPHLLLNHPWISSVADDLQSLFGSSTYGIQYAFTMTSMESHSWTIFPELIYDFASNSHINPFLCRLTYFTEQFQLISSMKYDRRLHHNRSNDPDAMTYTAYEARNNILPFPITPLSLFDRLQRIEETIPDFTTVHKFDTSYYDDHFNALNDPQELPL